MKMLIASSNDNITTGFSFSPSELYADQEGNAFVETYSSRQAAEQFDCDSLEPVGCISTYFENGFWNTTGEEIKNRFESISWEII